MKTTLKRGAGILMPVSSLPSPYGIGTFGQAAYDFVDFLVMARQRYWQVLPLDPTSFGDSPYQSYSAFAGNPYFIDLDILAAEGLLTQAEIDACEWGDDEASVDYDAVGKYRYPLLRKAFERSGYRDEESYGKFCEDSRYWLNDYALYMALKNHFDNVEWALWPDDIKYREEDAVERYSAILADDIEFWKFLQYKFFEQWEKLRTYANGKGISIIGDIPIYVAYDSADIWVHPELFMLDEKSLAPTLVSGVPPDIFSEDGQFWGNPLYRWDVHEATDFAWWRERMKSCAKLYDVVRIDHFIGIVQYYSIPADAENARNGEWFAGPGKKLTDAIDQAVGDTKIVAEDLGISVPGVKDLLEETGYPGMKILQFAFSGDSFNEHLPHMYDPNTIVYGGTHDNETLVGYFDPEKCDPRELQYLVDYTGVSHQSDIVSRLIALAYESVASVAIFQAQDILRLDNSARMNTPATIGGNWKWRECDGELGENEALELAKLVDTYGRF